MSDVILAASPRRMSVISAIVPITRRPGRFDVIVDERSIAILSVDAIERLKLAVGRSVDEMMERIAVESARLKVYDRALSLLAFRARSSVELARSLVRKGEDKHHVEYVIERLREQGLLDDAAFARAYTRAKALGAKQPRRRVQQGLARKGIARDVSDAAVADVFEEEALDQLDLVMSVARKKLDTLRALDAAVQRRRLYAFLARRGHDSDDIRRAMELLGSGPPRV